MKKFITIALSALFVFGMAATGVTLNAKATAESTPAAQAEIATVYLVPGNYKDVNGDTVYNTLTSGATKLTDDESAAIHTPNAYKCTLSAGDELPEPATTKTGVTFNGWWTIEDANVVYHETLPVANETLFLYADWRAELSQPSKPIIPDESVEQEYPHYMEVKRAATGRTEKIQLFVSGTDVPNAVQAGYGGPVQFYNEWFQLSEGDEIKFYVSNVFGKLPTLAPQNVANTRKITLEISGAGNPDKSTPSSIKCLINGEIPDWAFSGDYSSPLNGEPMVRCVRKDTNNFRVYIKFYDNGGTMTIYMERLSSAN